MKKKLFGLLGITLVASLSGCMNTYDDYRTILCPSGAPALSLIRSCKGNNYITFNKSVAQVGSQLLEDNYGAIVFDFYTGLKTIKNSQDKESRKHSSYKLWRIVTGGNLYILGLGEGKTTGPEAGDRVVSFGENSLPDLVFKKIYENTLSTFTIDYTSNGVSDIAPIIISGQYNGSKVDYVLVAEPILTKAINATSIKHSNPISLSSLWGDVIPQAGLFVHNKAYKAYAEYFNKWYKTYDANTKEAANPDKRNDIANFMNETWPKYEDQVSKFGFDSSLVKSIQETNGFALVSDGTWNDGTKPSGVNLNSFFTRLGITEDFSDFIVDPSVIG